MKRGILLGMALSAFGAAAEARRVTPLTDGWTADGVPVTLPHTWNAVDAADGPAPGYGFNAIGWSSARDEVGSYLRQRVVYRRELPAPRPGRRVFFRCDGASARANVRLNGIQVGQHDGAYTAFCCELTSVLRPTGNVLEVAVDNRRDQNVPTTSADFPLFGGIYRACWLIETDTVCIDPCWYGGPGVAVKTDAATGEVRVEVRQSGGETNAVFRVGERSWTASPFVLKDFRRWSPETPVVYELTVELANGDAVTVPFGFRDTGFDADGRYCLNGQVRKLRGVNRHQDRAGKGWCLTPADEAEDIALIKRMGADALRTAHYPQSQNLYDLCDREGIVCWVELPCTDELTVSATHRLCLEEMVREMVAQLGNHPSVCMWSVYNEVGIVQTDIPRIRAQLVAFERLFKELDPSRPTVAASMHRHLTRIHDFTDAMAFNFYPGWYSNDAGDMTEKGVSAWLQANPHLKTTGVSEYGAGASAGHHQLPWKKVWHQSRFHPEEYQAFVHMGQYRAIRADARVWGSFVWNMFDFAADVRCEGACRGINDKGLVTYDRAHCKDAYYFYQANWAKQPVLHVVGSYAHAVEASRVPVLVFSNCGEVTLRVNGETVGTRAPDEVACAAFADVRMKGGENVIEVEAGPCRQRLFWFCPVDDQL